MCNVYYVTINQQAIRDFIAITHFGNPTWNLP
jgi:hypothetical protein